MIQTSFYLNFRFLICLWLELKLQNAAEFEKILWEYTHSTNIFFHTARKLKNDFDDQFFSSKNFDDFGHSYSYYSVALKSMRFLFHGHWIIITTDRLRKNY